MRILFDARGVQDRSDGLSHYVRHLLIGLLRADPTNTYTVILGPTMRAHLERAGLLGRPNLHLIETSIPFMGLDQQFRLPLLVRRYPPADVYHYPHFDLPLLAHPRSVVTIYDVNHVSLASYFESLRTLKRLYSLGTTAMGITRAQHIITISEASKRQLLERFPWLDPRKVTVTYFGLNDRFQTPPGPEKTREFRQRFKLGQDRFILYVGTHRPHKNVSRLIEAYERLRRGQGISQKLLLVGSPNGDGSVPRTIQALGLQEHVRLLGHIADDELPLAYRMADVFIYCSLSEGFGMPLLEAMASEVPIVTSNVGAMAEVVGESAVLVNPYSVDSIAEGMSRALSSESLRWELIARGQARLQRFRWEEAVSKTLTVYKWAGKGQSHKAGFAGWV